MCWRHCESLVSRLSSLAATSGTSRPTPPTPPASRFTSFDIGWMRNTSSQLTAGVVAQLAPGLVIFQTLPWPVVPSLVQRLPRRSKANPLVPGTPVAKISGDRRSLWHWG